MNLFSHVKIFLFGWPSVPSTPIAVEDDIYAHKVSSLGTV